MNITLPNGDVKEYAKGVTGYDIAMDISPRLASDALAVKVDGKVIDLNRSITSDATVQILTFKDEEGKEVYWHSTSHLMAHAVESLFPGAKFGVGPAIEAGFYYDIDIDKVLVPEDLEKIENKMREIAKEDKPFQRVELSKDEAIKQFTEKGDEYKLDLLEGFDEDEEAISLYEEGSFTDLCRGPHVPSAGRLKYFKLLNISGSYWRGDANNKQLQRIYGVSFPKKKDLEEHIQLLEEAKKRDHRKLGKELDLFSFHDISPGAPFWHPRGMVIFKELETLIRDVLEQNEYDEILTPILVKKELWEQSGHWEHYQENMFLVEAEEQVFGLKPMNCPESTYVYNTKVRSYRDLPLRYSEIGRNHRNELTGALNGMFRVRQFHMDDAHIFLRPDQILDELTKLLKMVNNFYKIFGFEPSYKLSTRPEKALGAVELWNTAEEGLEEALKANEIPYTLNPGDGAFYGPKIDISIRDALKRSWQLATIQLDFNLPERFELEYIDENNERQRPVMIHRAIMGSFERFIAVLIEHFAGAFPVWLSPIQVAVMPISDNQMQYAKDVYATLRENGIRTELDERNEKIGYKIRDWEVHKVPYMLIIGEKEVQANSVAVRKHKEGDEGAVPLDEFIGRIQNEIQHKQS
ncbi:MAG: threonine--tRNA ligase [Ectothiorhodospiraceae bacterium]|nr:threonine--tRNA ligase [Ectothiorhodospiraceae bacterium]